jgi:DNA-binding response OmpR family regulator
MDQTPVYPLNPQPVHVVDAKNLSFAMTALVADAQGGESIAGEVGEAGAAGPQTRPGVDGVNAPVRHKTVSPSSSPILPPILSPYVQAPKSMVFKGGQAVQSGLMRVGLLEDSSVEAERITQLFEESGFRVVQCGSGADFLKLLQSESFDLLVLDWNVPDVSGIEVLRHIREGVHLAVPVLMLTSRASEYEVVQALNRGADDYLQKPWKPFELVARANALMRRQRLADVNRNERHCDFVLDGGTLLVTRNDRTVKLSHKEFLLFQLLVRHINSPVSRAHIVQAVWNGESLEARTVDVHVSRVRQKLGLTAQSGYSLTSIYGYGYRLERLEAPETPVKLAKQKNEEA